MDDLQTVQQHVLVVDDSDDDRAMVAQYLTMKGYQVSKARDGRDGLKKALELQPDLILIDLWLPLVSGWEALQRLRADEKTKDIPVVVVTGHSFVRPLDCEGLLLKPLRLNDLGALIARILKSRREGKTPSAPRKESKVEKTETTM